MTPKRTGGSLVICDEHGEFECSICFSSNPHWNSAKQEVHLTPRVLRVAIQHIKTSQGVCNARRRNQRADAD